MTRERFGLSIRRVCCLVGLGRSTWQYRPHRPDDSALRQRLRELAAQRRRFGAPRLHVLLRREGWVVNHKRVERLYRAEGLALRRKRHRKRAAGSIWIGSTAATPSPSVTITIRSIWASAACG